MDLEKAQKIVEWLEGEGYEAKVDEHYSGRGMFGRTTAGVITDSVAIVHEAKGALGIRGGFSSDSMGLGVVVY